MGTPTRKEQFAALVREAASELKLPRGDDRTRRLAVIRLQRRVLIEIQEQKLLANQAYDPSRAVEADAKLALQEEQLLEGAPEALTHRLEIEIIGRDKIPIADLPVRPSGSSPPQGAVSDRPAGNNAPAGLCATPTAPTSHAEATAEVERLRRELRRAEQLERDLIAQACAPPLKPAGSDWNVFIDPVMRGGDPFHAGPMPNFSASHKLPTP